MQESSVKQILSDSALPTAETEILLSHVLAKDRSYLRAYSETLLSREQCNTYSQLYQRRLKNEPIQYLTNKQEFYGLEFYVDSRVLIPRPETEELVNLAIKHYLRNPSREHGRGFHPFPSSYNIVEVGTGSGNIAISLAKNLPENVQITAIDRSKDALEVASMNSAKHNTQTRIQFRHGYLLEPLLSELPENSIDLIVANLPYISSHMYNALEPHIKDYEPMEALLGGPTGTELYEELFSQSPSLLRPGGLIFYELDGEILVK